LEKFFLLKTPFVTKIGMTFLYKNMDLTAHSPLLRPPPGPKVQVLIIDDQSVGRAILEQIVRSIDQNIETHTYSDPFEALRWAQLNEVDLVLTDYKMPKMDGIALIKELRKLPGFDDVPMVVVTIIEEKGVRYEALESGATDFLTKPIDQHECRARCRNLLTMRRQQMMIQDRAKLLENRISEATHEIRSREVETLFRLAKAGEYRDLETANHVIRMAKYSRIIAEGLELDETEADLIELAAPMHDVGKIGIPDHILLKPGKLTAEEFDIMKRHPSIGYEILKDSPSKYLRMGAVIALGHHEKFDGSGYPHQLKADEIPLPSRIVAVADVYDALTTVRPYKKAWTTQEAIDYLLQNKGSHFDPACVDALIDRIDLAMYIAKAFKDEETNQQQP